MALPQDFWQNDHMFHRFRSKPCQRLLRSGLCEWHSQCQFSHDPEFPRRPPNKHSYSPVLCPHIRPVVLNNSGEVHLENHCQAGAACAFAHTKDEVLYHPSIFKTSLCEEHRSLTSDQRNARRSKHRPRCHRYYCPFAHGKLEIRTSPMPAEHREAVVRAIGIFPHGGCCGICSRNQLGAVCLDGSSGLGFANNISTGQQASILASQLWHTSAPNLLSQIFMTGTNETTSAETGDGHVWGASTWLQQPLQQEVGGLDASLKILDDIAATKDNFDIRDGEKSTQDLDADDDGDIGSEIYERAVRFLDEISTEESGSSDREWPMDKKADDHVSVICRSQAITEPLYSNATFSPVLSSQEPWVADVNGGARWPGASCWTIPSIDRIAK